MTTNKFMLERMLKIINAAEEIERQQYILWDSLSHIESLAFGEDAHTVVFKQPFQIRVYETPESTYRVEKKIVEYTHCGERRVLTTEDMETIPVDNTIGNENLIVLAVSLLELIKD